MFDLTDKVVLLTGIGAIGQGWGNGTTIAAVFARQGATVFGCDINVEAAQKAAEEICNDAAVQSHPARRSDRPAVEILDQSTVSRSRTGSSRHDMVPSLWRFYRKLTGSHLVQDVTQKNACEAFVNACMQKHGRIDILVNNVGKSEPGGPAEMSEEVWDMQTDVNLKSVYLMCHLVLPIMEKQMTGGRVLNVSSVAGLRYIGKPQVAYAACKAAIIQFTKTTAVIYAQRTGGKVRLNTVVPGLINSPLVTVLANKYAGGDQEGYRKTRDAQVPTGKMGQYHTPDLSSMS